MGSSIVAQLRCSTWRHYLNHMRQWPWLLGILAVAMFPFALLAILKASVPPQKQESCHFMARSVSSHWPMSLVQSFVCNLPNDCQDDAQDDFVDTYPGAIINPLLNGSTSFTDQEDEGMFSKLVSLPLSISRLANVTKFLTHPNLTQLMENGLRVRDVIRSPTNLTAELIDDFGFDPRIVETILEAKIDMARVVSLVGYTDLNTLVCTPDQLGQFLLTPAREQLDNISSNLCNIHKNQTVNITRVFIGSLDATNLFDKVSEVLEAIGGYEAESLVHQVGGLLASLGRLESLAPMASVLDTLTTVISPLTSAVSTLHDTGWDSERVTQLLSMVEGVMEPASSSYSTSGMHSARSVRLLLAPENMTRIITEEQRTEPWKQLLQTGVDAVANTGIQLSNITREIERFPEAHALLMMATSVLPTLLGPEPTNITKLGASIDTAIERMTPEIGGNITALIPSLHLMMYMASSSLQVTNYAAQWLQELPSSIGLNVLRVFSNITLTKNLVNENRLVSWTCTRSSWPDMSEADWLTFENHLCNTNKVGNLHEIKNLLMPIVDPVELQQFLASYSTPNVTSLLLDSKKFLESLQNSTRFLFSQSSSRRKRSVASQVEDYLGELPPGDAQVIEIVEQGIQGSKHFIQNMTLIYLNLAKSSVDELQEADLMEHVPIVVLAFLDYRQVGQVADVVSSMLDVVIQVTRIMKTSWQLSDLRPLDLLRDILVQILPEDVMSGVTATLDLLETPMVEVPGPIPQILDILNASYGILTEINQKGSLVEWAKESRPYTAGLLQQVGILPRILAIPFLWQLNGMSLNMFQILSDGSAWMHYPCGDTTLVSLYPPASDVPHLPDSWADLEDVKLKVRRLEMYICENGTRISEEMTYDPTFTRSVRNLVENMVPRGINVGSSIQLIKSMIDELYATDPQTIFSDLTSPGESTLLQEFQNSFGVSSASPRHFVSRLMHMVDIGLIMLSNNTDTRETSSNIQFFMHHGKLIADAVTGILRSNLSLATLVGLPTDYEPLVLLQENPSGTADFILQELLDLSISVILDQPIVWSSWIVEVCDRSVGRSSVVTLACYFIRQPPPPTLQSPLTNAIATAATAYQQGNTNVPRVLFQDLFNSGEDLVGSIVDFDVNGLPDLSSIGQFWNSILQEGEMIFQGLGRLQEDWVFRIADAGATRHYPLLQRLTDIETFLSWLNNTLPENLIDLTSGLPPTLKEIHDTLNSSWIDLLDGLQYNLELQPELTSRSLSEICTSTSNFQDPAGGAGQFQETIGELCTLFSSFDVREFNGWLNYEQLINDQRNGSRTFSSRRLYRLAEDLLSRARGYLQHLSTFPSSPLPFPLPTYMQMDKWEELLQRISARNNDSDLFRAIELAEVALGWVTDSNEPVVLNLLRMITLQNSIAEKIGARNLTDLVQNYSALENLLTTVTSHIPRALKDLVGMVARNPDEVVYVFTTWPGNGSDWATICQLDWQQMGPDLQTTVSRLCLTDQNELLLDLNSLLGLGVFQETWTPDDLKVTINKSLVLWSQVAEQFRDGSFLQKFSDLGLYLELGTWRSIPTMVFNVTSDSMWENSTMILAAVLEPIVALSREPTEDGRVVKGMLQKLDKNLRWARLLLALAKGGDLWKAVKEAYVDKPVVSRFFDVLQTFPQFILEYIEVFGNYSMISQAMSFQSDTPCNLHLFLLDGHREQLEANATSVLSTVLEYLCNQEQMSLLPAQLVPDSPPVIANTTMEVDGAMLAMLLDYVGWDFIYILQGDFYEGPLQIPGWANESSWQRVVTKLQNLLSIPPKELLILGTGISLDATRLNLGDQFIVPTVSVVYQVSTRLASSINESTGNIDLNVVFNGLGRLQEVQQSLEPLLPDLVAVVLWIFESQAYERSILLGESPVDIYSRACDEGFDRWLYHPYLTQAEWGTLQHAFCFQETPRMEDLAQLANSSEIMNGSTIDWMKIGESIERLLRKIPHADLTKFITPLSRNAFITHIENLSPAQRFIEGIEAGPLFLTQWFYESNPEDRHQSALTYIWTIAALRPITSHSESLYRRLADLQMFKQLLREYANVVGAITNSTALLDHQYQVQLTPGLIQGLNLEGLVEAYQGAVANTSHPQLFAEFRRTILNLSRALLPGEQTSELPLTTSEVLYNLTSNIMHSTRELVGVVESPTCELLLSGVQWAFTIQNVGKSLLMATRHLREWDSYVSLTCQLPSLNWTDVMQVLLEDYGWKRDIQEFMRDDQVLNATLNCPFAFDQSMILQSQAFSILDQFVTNETARSVLQSCLVAAVNSTAGLQFRGLISAVGGLFESGSGSNNMDVAVMAAIDTIPGASSSLRTLASRITVLVPFTQILSTGAENNLNLPPEVMSVVRDELWVDVNRIYGTDSLKLSKLFSSKEKMEKVFQIKQREEADSERVKREVSPMDNLYEAIQAMGEGVFAENILANVNYTYLFDEIDNLRMNALLSSQWLMPIMEHMNSAVTSLSKLSELEAVLDLGKIISGEVDAVTFLVGSVQLMQMKLWSDLATSFSQILETSVPIITGSELGDDLQNVVDGVTNLQGVVSLATLDFTIPMTSLVTNWTAMQEYMTSLGINPDVIEALGGSELNVMEVLSLQDVTLEEVICQGVKMESIVNLPEDTTVTLNNISHSLCYSSKEENEALATTFLRHLDIGPIIDTFTKFGVNATLATYGLTLEEMVDSLKILREASVFLPKMMETLQSLRDVLVKPEELQDLTQTTTQTTIVEELASPEFLERAGQVLCGRPLRLVPDSLGILKAKSTEVHSSAGSDDMCKKIERDIQKLPGGKILLHFIKPLMDGTIFYTPKNAITEKIIAQANKTFESVGKQQMMLKSLQGLSKSLASSSNNDSDLMRLEEALEKTWLQGMLQQMFPNEDDLTLSEEIQEASPKLKEAARLAEEFSDILTVGVEMISCLKLQRFVGVDSESEMVRQAEEAVKKNEFLAGIVFDGLGQTGDSDEVLPKGIAYSIRVDFEKTPSTFRLGPRFWRPGPYANMAIHMRYHQGFLLLQEMMDRAILELQFEQNNPQAMTSSPVHGNPSAPVSLRGHGSPENVWASGSQHVPWGGPPHVPHRRKRDTTVDIASSEEAKLIMNLPVYTKQQPYPCYEKDEFMGMLNESPVLSLIVSFVAFTIFIVFLIQHLVQEKKSRNRQLQEVMGMKAWLDHLVWFFFSILILLVILLILTLITKFGGLQPKVNFGVLFAFLFCYGVSLISLCVLVSCLVKTPVLAVFIGVMSTLVFNVPFVSISVLQAHTSFNVIILTCFLPPSAFGFGFRVICQYELLGIGANYSNLWTSPVRGSDMTLGISIVMLLVDTILFYALALIVTALKNGPLRRFMRKGRGEVAPSPVFSGEGSLKRSHDFTFNIFQEDNIRTLDVDPGVKQSFKKGLNIVGLRRIYQQRGRSKVAVDNLNLELYEGQVLALLGHNGAGKTTIISIITREVEATAGNIQVYGHDIRTSWSKARSLIGLCPQQSVLFPLMTVQETLLYYAILKGTARDQAGTEVNTVLVDMGLFEHRQYLGRQLSEGLRRRLCLAIAFVGGSKLIILDEPTSGVDPAARTAMWEVISSNRGGRTILLTTHHLDEAETLADRVAILHQGRLLCVGSPLSLKSEYGSGYSITLSNRETRSKVEAEAADRTKSRLKESKDFSFPNVRFEVPNTAGVWNLVKKYVPNVKLLEAMNGEMTYSLPLIDNKGDENRISEMFGELEGSLEDLGFSSLEIRPTNLEDVVIALNTINSIDNNSVTQSRVTLVPEAEKEESLKDAYNFKPRESLEGSMLGFQRLRALMYKRLLSHGRSWLFYVQMFLLPLLFIILAMVGSIFRPYFEGTAALTLNPEMYDSSSAFIRTLDPSLSKLAEELVGSGQWDTCPSKVSSQNQGLPSCNISATGTVSKCNCDGFQCWVDVTNQSSLDDWLLATRLNHVQNRYGGISLGVEDPRVTGGRPGVTVWYDNAGYHALPAYLNLFNNARLRRLVGDDYNITTTNYPIKFTTYSFSSVSVQQHVADLGIGLLILVSLTVVVSATAGYVVSERVRGERRVLYVAGINRNVYWTSNMLWDITVLVLNVLLTALVLLLFNQQQFVYRHNLGAFIVLALLYGLSILPLFYLVEGVFKSEASAVFTFFSATFGVGLITSLILVTCQFYSWVKELDYDTESTMLTLQEVEGVLQYVFLLFPPFTFAIGMKDLALGYTKAAILSRFGMDAYISPFTWDSSMQGGLGVHFVALASWAIVATVILHVWRDCFGPLPQPPTTAKSIAGAEEDKDVAAERIKIQCGGASLYDTVLRMVGLGKDFTSPPSAAVTNLFLALRRGECFSLLGLNGAGKTTTFRCVTGDLRPTRGQILINGQLLQEALALPKAVMGYCPQSHALDPNLTPREALSVMALVRGFPSSETTPILNKVLEQLGLMDDHNTYIGHLSGGTKRKVSTALALLGNPLLVLLDEPTTGLDPTSRRGIWSAIKSVTQDGRTVLLTSHSMDEVNVLSHRMAIMVNGYFVCMGSPHYLKNKLGDKYTIRLKTNAIEDMSPVVDYLRSQLTDILLKEQHHLTLVVEVNRRLPLRLIFDCLNTSRSLGVMEYDVSQTTLDEVFRLLTSYQGDGQLPPPPVGNDAEQAGLPMHLSNLHPAGVNLPPEPTTFQKPDVLFRPSSRLQTADANSRLPSVETDRPSVDRSSFYDNIGITGDSQSEIYATVGKPRSPKMPSPDIESIGTESGSAEDSPEEEWTHL